MTALRTAWPLVVAAVVATASLGLITAAVPPRAAPATAEPLAVDARLASAKRAFARPASLVDDGRVRSDPVWRLGERLFNEAAASGSGRIACATCHRPDRAWADPQARAVGDNGQPMAFKAPTLLNVGMLDRLGWTGRFPDTATVALFAMNSAATMNMPTSDFIGYLHGKPDYEAAFARAFGDGAVTRENIGAALARYVDSITAAPAPFDRWVAGDEAAIGAPAKRGFALFTGKAGCAECHSGWAFTDGSYHDIGTSETDPGRGRYFPTSLKLQHAFKTPSLRGVAERPPYMHDGSLATLDAVIDLYDRGGVDRPSRAEPIRPLHLSPSEKADLEALLLTLSGGTAFVAR